MVVVHQTGRQFLDALGTIVLLNIGDETLEIYTIDDWSDATPHWANYFLSYVNTYTGPAFTIDLSCITVVKQLLIRPSRNSVTLKSE